MQWIQGKEPQRYGIFQVDSMWYYVRMSNNLAFPFQLSLPCFTMYAVLVDPLPLIAFSKVYSCPFIHVLEPLLTIFPSHFWFFALSLTLCTLYSPWYSPSQTTGVSSLSLFQVIFPTQGLKPGLPHYRWILYWLNHKGSPRILEWVTYPFSSGSSQPRNRTRVSCIAGRFFTNWSIRETLLYDK